MKPYTCNDYRQEMMLAALRKQLNDPSLREVDRQKLEREIARLKAEMGMD
jgi:hypothetical protein